MTNIISIYNLSKAFDGKKLFQNFNFTVKKNSVHALIGANGAGKTTLLRLLTGLYEPDEGKISVSGKHAMLLENDYLYEDKTGLENLKIFGLYFGYYVKDYKKYSDSLNISCSDCNPFFMEWSWCNYFGWSIISRRLSAFVQHGN